MYFCTLSIVSLFLSGCASLPFYSDGDAFQAVRVSVTSSSSLSSSELEHALEEILMKARCDDHAEISCENCTSLLLSAHPVITNLSDWNEMSSAALYAVLNITHFCQLTDLSQHNFSQQILSMITLGEAPENLGEEEIEALLGLFSEATEEEHGEEDGEVPGEAEAVEEDDHDEEGENHEEDGEAGEEGGHSEKCFSENHLLYDLGYDHDELIPLSKLNTIFGQLISYMMQDMSFSESCELLPKKSEIVDELFEQLTNSNSSTIDEEGFEALLSSLDVGTPVVTVEEEGDGHGHKRKRRSIKTLLRRTKREVEESPAHKCLSEAEYATIYDLDLEAGLTKENFIALCPALIQQKIGNFCVSIPEVTPTSAPESNAHVYGYGTLAVVVISLLSLLGAVLIPCFDKLAVGYVLHGFVALGVGTMYGDALLHLLPQALGLHAHAEGEGTATVSLSENTLIMLVVSLSLYAFFLLETLMTICRPKTLVHHHTHAHNLGHDLVTGEADELPSVEDSDNNSDVKWAIKPDVKQDGKHKPFISTVALLIALGDAVHNLLDGLAIGAAFSSSIEEGFGTSVAVFCHELPHELGDFSIYLQTGMSKCKALILNLSSACFCLVGFYIGAALSENTESRRWLIAATAGMFFYVSLVDMMPELLAEKKKGNKWVYFTTAHLGILLGVGIMLIISAVEELLVSTF